MHVQVMRVIPDDGRLTKELDAGELVHHRVELQVEGEPMSFDVALRAKIVGHFDASILHGDEHLEELLRFSPAALNAVLAAVGRVRRGLPVDLPLDIEASFDAPTSRTIAR